MASPTSAEMAKEVHGPTMCIESLIQSDLPCQKVTHNSQPLAQVALLMQGLLALLMQGLCLTLVQPLNFFFSYFYAPYADAKVATAIATLVSYDPKNQRAKGQRQLQLKLKLKWVYLKAPRTLIHRLWKREGCFPTSQLPSVAFIAYFERLEFRDLSGAQIDCS